MKQTIIPAGYRLSISSWENDADASETQILEGLSKERVKFLLELCKLFRSKNQYKNCFGNMYDGSRLERAAAEAAITAVLEKHRAVLNEYELEQLAAETNPEDEFSGPEYGDIVGDLIGYSAGYTYRVYNGAKVEYIPHEIRMDDVTKQFNI